MTDWMAVRLILFILGQTVGVGVFAMGSALGLVSMIGTSYSGYLGIKELVERIEKT